MQIYPCTLVHKIKIDAGEPEILSYLLHSFFFLVKMWCLHYPQFPSTANNLRVMRVADNVASSLKQR